MQLQTDSELRRTTVFDRAMMWSVSECLTAMTFVPKNDLKE